MMTHGISWMNVAAEFKHIPHIAAKRLYLQDEIKPEMAHLLLCDI